MTSALQALKILWILIVKSKNLLASPSRQLLQLLDSWLSFQDLSTQLLRFWNLLLIFKSRSMNTPLSIFQALIAANQSAPNEVESTSNHHHPAVSSALEMLTFIMTHQPVFVDAKLDSTMQLIIKMESAASHASVSSAQLVPPQPPPNALHVSLVPLLIQIISATVFQDTWKLQEIAKLALPSAMAAKL